MGERSFFLLLGNVKILQVLVKYLLVPRVWAMSLNSILDLFQVHKLFPQDDIIDFTVEIVRKTRSLESCFYEVEESWVFIKGNQVTEAGEFVPKILSASSTALPQAF